MPEFYEMVRALYDAKECVEFEPTPWEDSFIDDLYEKVEDDKFKPSEKQTEKIDELYSRHCG